MGEHEKKQVKRLHDQITSRGRGYTIMIANQKGGVGKTTNTYLIGYTLAKMGVRTLVADLDPQSHSTKTLMLTKSHDSEEVNAVSKTLMLGVQEHDLTDLIVPILPNLDLVPSYIDFADFPKYLYKNTSDEYGETHLLQPLFAPLIPKYDVVLFDMPPLNLEITRNAVVMTDYIIVSLQTQEDSLTGAHDFINVLLKLKKEYDLPVEILGFLPMLLDRRGPVDKYILTAATKEFGQENLFKEMVPQMARIKRFPINGITDNDKFDKKVLAKYQRVTTEVIDRLLYFEEG